jgi:hypothetical protein
MNQFQKTGLIIVILGILTLFSAKVLKASISFTIANPVVNSQDEIQVDATISGLISQSCLNGRCYLQGVLQKIDGANYFGFTQNNSGDWYEYDSSPVIEFLLSTYYFFEPVAGSWWGPITVKNNIADAAYLGPGEYLLKLKRFSGKAVSSAGDSNTLTVKLTKTPVPTPTPFPSPTPDPTATPAPTKTPTPIPTKTPTPAPTLAPSPIPTNSNQPDVLSASTILPSPQSPGLAQDTTGKPKEKIPLQAIGFITLGIGFISFSVFSIIKNIKKSYTVESEKDNQIS